MHLQNLCCCCFSKCRNTENVLEGKVLVFGPFFRLQSKKFSFKELEQLFWRCFKKCENTFFFWKNMRVLKAIWTYYFLGTHEMLIKRKKRLTVILMACICKKVEFESSKTILNKSRLFTTSDHTIRRGVWTEISTKNEKRRNTKSWLNVAKQQKTSLFFRITEKNVWSIWDFNILSQHLNASILWKNDKKKSLNTIVFIFLLFFPFFGLLENAKRFFFCKAAVFFSAVYSIVYQWSQCICLRNIYIETEREGKKNYFWRIVSAENIIKWFYLSFFFDFYSKLRDKFHLKESRNYLQ